MALKKKVITQGGLPLEYHRVALVSIEPNQQITILRHSYLDEEARQYEKDYAAGKIEGEPAFPYVGHEYVHVEFADGVDAFEDGIMEGAYALLKRRMPELAGAEDC